MTDEKGFGPAVDGETTECKFCRKQIDEKATRCPYCESWQDGRVDRTGVNRRRTTMIVTAVVLGLAFPSIVVFLILSGLVPDPDPSPDTFEAHRSAVTIVEAKMVSDSYSVAVLGEVQNDSPVTWESVLIEAVFLDAEGGVIDNATETIHAGIPPGKSLAFKASTTTASPEEEYKDFRVRIVTAKEPRF